MESEGLQPWQPLGSWASSPTSNALGLPLEQKQGCAIVATETGIVWALSPVCLRGISLVPAGD